MKNVSGLQVALVSVLMMVAHYFQFPLAESQAVGLVGGVFSIVAILWEIYSGYKNGTHSFGGFRK